MLEEEAKGQEKEGDGEIRVEESDCRRDDVGGTMSGTEELPGKSDCVWLPR